MADVTWGVKVPEELRDQISAFMKVCKEKILCSNS